MGVQERVLDIVEPIVEDLDLYLFDLDYAGGRLKITIDTVDGVESVDSSLLTLCTRQISRELDEVDPISGKYTLEVSTPGVERRLRRPDHFHRSIGMDITVKLGAHVEGERRFSGALVAADDKTFTIADADGDKTELNYDDAAKVRTTFEWGPKPKPGGPKTTKKAGAK